MLIIIKAEDVRDGEPRWWYSSMKRAELGMAEAIRSGSRPVKAGSGAARWTRAIVDRPAPAPAAAPGSCGAFVARWDHAMCSRCGEEHGGSDPVTDPPLDDRRMMNVAISHLTAIADGSAAQHGAERMRAGIALDALRAIVDRPAPATPPALDLDALEAHDRAMTAGPWEVANHSDDSGCTFGPHDMCVGDIEDAATSYGSAERNANAAGIVAIRNAAPALIAEVRRLRAGLAEAKRLGLEACYLADEAAGSASEAPDCAEQVTDYRQREVAIRSSLKGL